MIDENDFEKQQLAGKSAGGQPAGGQVKDLNFRNAPDQGALDKAFTNTRNLIRSRATTASQKSQAVKAYKALQSGKVDEDTYRSMRLAAQSRGRTSASRGAEIALLEMGNELRNDPSQVLKGLAAAQAPAANDDEAQDMADRMIADATGGQKKSADTAPGVVRGLGGLGGNFQDAVNVNRRAGNSPVPSPTGQPAGVDFRYLDQQDKFADPYRV